MKKLILLLGGVTVIAPIILIVITVALALAGPAHAQHWQWTPWGPQHSLAAYGPTRLPPGFNPNAPPDPYACQFNRRYCGIEAKPCSEFRAEKVALLILEPPAGASATMASTNKCLAQSNKSQTGGAKRPRGDHICRSR